MGASGVEYILMQQVIIGSETAVFEFALKAIASLIALVGAYLAVRKYFDEKGKANETARTESQKPFSAKQQEIYFDLLSTTALLANRNNIEDPDRVEAEKHFWVLFWGAIPMVADEGVSAALDRFAETLDKLEKPGDPQKGIAMRNASMDLARACRRSLGESWNVPLQHYEKSNQAGKR